MMIGGKSDPSPEWTICADSVITRTISASDEDSDHDHDHDHDGGDDHDASPSWNMAKR